MATSKRASPSAPARHHAPLALGQRLSRIDAARVLFAREATQRGHRSSHRGDRAARRHALAAHCAARAARRLRRFRPGVLARRRRALTHRRRRWQRRRCRRARGRRGMIRRVTRRHGRRRRRRSGNEHLPPSSDVGLRLFYCRGLRPFGRLPHVAIRRDARSARRAPGDASAADAEKTQKEEPTAHSDANAEERRRQRHQAIRKSHGVQTGASRLLLGKNVRRRASLTGRRRLQPLWRASARKMG